MVVAARLEDGLDVEPALQAPQRIERRVVDALGAEAAAEDEHRGFARSEPELAQRLLTVAREQVRPHGIARDPEVIAAREVAARLEERKVHLGRDTGEPAIGEPGDAVLLLDQQRPPREARGQRERAAHVAARAEHRARTFGDEDEQRLEEAGDVDERGPRPAPPAAPREPGREQEADREARLRDRGRLDAAPAPDEHHLDVGADAMQFLGHGDAREHVAAGAAARDQDLHAGLRQRCLVNASACVLATLMRYSSPEAARFTSRAEPP